MVTINRSIALVGLMGAGKTSVGRKLAELLRVEFVDTDDEIVSAAHMTIPEIFERFGEAEFRSLERRVITRVMQGPPHVVATGGGAFMQGDIRDAIAQDGVSVWLSAPLEVLWRRVADKPGRPLLETEDPKGTLAGLLEDRGPVYAKADVVVETGETSVQLDVAKDIIRGLIGFDQGHPNRRVFADGAGA